MADGEDRVTEEHLRTGDAHHLLDLFPAFRLVTMDWAPGARGFVFLERTLLESRQGIGKQFLAGGAERTIRLVTLPTEDVDHGRHGAPLANEARAGSCFRTGRSAHRGIHYFIGSRVSNYEADAAGRAAVWSALP